MSLIGAVPGAVLTYLLVMAPASSDEAFGPLVYHFSDMVGMMRMVVCLILVLSVLMTVMPVGILLFIKEEKPDKADEAEPDEDEPAETLDEVGAEDVGVVEVGAVEVAEDVPTEDSMGRQTLEPGETATAQLEDSGEMIDDIYEADEDPPKK